MNTDKQIYPSLEGEREDTISHERNIVIMKDMVKKKTIQIVMPYVNLCPEPFIVRGFQYWMTQHPNQPKILWNNTLF